MEYTQNKKLIELINNETLNSTELINLGSKLIRPEYAEGDTFNLMVTVKELVKKETIEAAKKRINDITWL